VRLVAQRQENEQLVHTGEIDQSSKINAELLN
jgi:Rrf2 family iron-sulfur cluster assembly transcriptional regulator